MLSIFYKLLAKYFDKCIVNYVVKGKDCKGKNFLKYIPKQSIQYMDQCFLHHYIRRDLDCFKYSYKFTEDLKQTCVMYCPKDIRYIQNPSEKIQDYVIRVSPDLLFAIDNPTRHIILKALKKSWNRKFYDRIMRHLNLDDRTIHEINKLKLEKDPMT